jgi:hypothetical protein
MKPIMIAPVTLSSTSVLVLALAPALAQDARPLAEAKLIIEHNATDADTGFQGFVDGEGWQQLIISGPDSEVVRFKARDGLAPLALTELFFETTEPLNA